MTTSEAIEQLDSLIDNSKSFMESDNDIWACDIEALNIAKAALQEKIEITHELKILPDYFSAVIREDKRFELRKFDRPYKIGDTLDLREWEPVSGYTGRSIRRKIKYILSKCPEYGLKEGLYFGFRIMPKM